ncbi:hypothetical protein HYX13_01105 [Candidatus Woesearchaeota archaeon]|nr:hypothetical protein [Candidatus Woesearchaeota archaeon]
MIKFTFGKCTTRAGFSAKLQQKGRLNLQKIKEKFEVVLETPILLVVREQELEVIVHQYGELLFKNGTQEKFSLMEDIVKRIYETGLER